MTTQTLHPARSTQIRLARRPVGWPEPADFEQITIELPELAAGEVRVENEFISVDPYMRGRMNDVESYVAPYALGETMTGGAVGRVVASASDELPVGTAVLHQQGWRDVAQGEAAAFRAVAELPGVPLSAYLGILGLTGFTAHLGLTTIASMRRGDTVFISGAAGAVGTAAGQIARLLGAERVIGSAGSAEKVALLTSRYGYDAAFNYRDGEVRTLLADAAPDGIDVYFDNVGGDHLEAALDAFRRGGRAALCGAISAYNTTGRASGPDNMSAFITKGLTATGFTTGDYAAHYPAFVSDMTEWFQAGTIEHDETIVDGIDNAVEAFLQLLQGANIGKMLVRTGTSA